MRKEGQNKDIHIPISTSIGTALIFSSAQQVEVLVDTFPFQLDHSLLDLKAHKKTIILYQFILDMEPRPLMN